MDRSMRGLAAILVIGVVLGGTADCRADSNSFSSHEAIRRLVESHPDLRISESSGRTSRLYGCAFGNGLSPEQTADEFRMRHSAVFGVSSEELLPQSRLKDGRHTQQLVFRPITGDYKFTLVYFTQYRSGLPVFRSDLKLLVRNQEGYPLVLASSDLRPLGDFSVHRKGDVRFDLAVDAALAEFPGLTEFSDPREIIYAGCYDNDHIPTRALEFTGSGGPAERWLFVADALTGEILYREDRIIFADILGSVTGLATQGDAAEHCEEELQEVMRYARVEADSVVAYADSDGVFGIEVTGIPPYNVTSRLWGEYFRVFNYGGSDAELTLSITPPDQAHFVHNAMNTEFYRAQVNGYVEANVARDLVLKYNPGFPFVSTQEEFHVNVNRDEEGICPGNAWYSP